MTSFNVLSVTDSLKSKFTICETIEQLKITGTINHTVADSFYVN